MWLKRRRRPGAPNLLSLARSRLPGGLISRRAIPAARDQIRQADVLHLHDWQTGLVSAYMSTLYRIDSFFAKTATVFTINNIAYQGNFAAGQRHGLGMKLEELATRPEGYSDSFVGFELLMEALGPSPSATSSASSPRASATRRSASPGGAATCCTARRGPARHRS